MPIPRAAGPAALRPDWCRIEARFGDDDDRDGGQADVYIFDEIGYWGTTARDFADQVAGLDVDTIILHLNSPGGDAWDGVAIANVLRRHRAKVNVIVEGLAASAASLIATAGNHITMAPSSMMMIHDASGFAWGDAATMRESADILDKLSDAYADAYAKRAGGTSAEWREVMRAETWYSAEEAVLAGLADEWDETLPAVAHAAFRHVQTRQHPPMAMGAADDHVVGLQPASPEPDQQAGPDAPTTTHEPNSGLLALLSTL